jgi:hypothetical protein
MLFYTFVAPFSDLRRTCNDFAAPATEYTVKQFLAGKECDPGIVGLLRTAAWQAWQQPRPASVFLTKIKQEY